jgi:transcriptional regulator with XRE-family HTH domain
MTTETDPVPRAPAAEEQAATARIARCIRAERERRAWSLAELAARAQLAKATISKIERAEMSPTAVTLLRLAGAFGLTLAGLLLRAEGGGGRLSRAAAQPIWRDPETGYVRRQIFASAGHPVELVQLDMPAGARITLPAASYAHIRQLLWVQSGALVVTEHQERHALAAGDCLAFGPPADVTIANETAAPCHYLVALART